VNDLYLDGKKCCGILTEGGVSLESGKLEHAIIGIGINVRNTSIAMPEEYAALDLQQMKELDEKYPTVAARVRNQLENGWEPTMTLLEQAVQEGIIRPVSLSVLRQMITASIESFLADRSLADSGVSYPTVLEEMISILMEGVIPR
jgi:biotin-(acetyl-CoA carboxylase) ligase